MYQQSLGDTQAPAAASTAYINQYYPSNYAPTTPIVAPGALSYYAFTHASTGQRAPEMAPAPAEPTVTPTVAQSAIRKLVTLELKNAGFEKAEPMTLKQLEFEVHAFVEQLYHRAHEYANLSNRAGAIAPDLIKACDEFDLPTNELHALAKKAKRKQRKVDAVACGTVLLPPKSRSPSPSLLASDDEGTAPALPQTLRMLPPHFPTLPPKHTYMKTPISPPKKAALPSLEKKLKTAGLVQKSLQNLLTATEENTNNEDAELLGHIVNWETGLHPRKRWKVRK